MPAPPDDRVLFQHEPFAGVVDAYLFIEPGERFNSHSLSVPDSDGQDDGHQHAWVWCSHCSPCHAWWRI
jgi:hypothetical protein